MPYDINIDNVEDMLGARVVVTDPGCVYANFKAGATYLGVLTKWEKKYLPFLGEELTLQNYILNPDIHPCLVLLIGDDFSCTLIGPDGVKIADGKESHRKIKSIW